jgi:acyl dehydratase
MRIFKGVPDVAAAVGTHLGYSEWHRVSQGQIDQFAQATGDHQWIHIDADRAKDGPFGSTIAHGFLTLALLPMLVAEVYRIDGVSMRVNYGADKLRFPTPVPVDSDLRAGVELTGLKPVAMGYQIASRVTIERRGGHKPACVVEMLGVVVP